MALIRLIADGTEAPCPMCGKGFKPGTMKVKRPSSKPSRGSVTVGGKAYIWVHEDCSPTRASGHGARARHR